MSKTRSGDGLSSPERPLSRRDALRAMMSGGLGLAAVRSAALVPGGRSVADLPRISALGPDATEAVTGQEAEILVRGGQVANADGVRSADVRIVGARIAEVAPELTPGEGARIIDATDQLVLPGGVDPHTHTTPPFADDLDTASQAALAGGITTIGTFSFAEDGDTPLDALVRSEEMAAEQAIADVFFHLHMWPPSAALTAAMPSLAERGHPSLKVFMVWDDFDANLPELIRQLEAARDAGVVTLIHCEDEVIARIVSQRLEAEGKTSLRFYGESRPVLVEAAATQRAAALCELTRAPMYVVHLSSSRALQACRNPATADLPLFVETRPTYLHLSEERFDEPDPGLYVGQPPLRGRADVEAMWQGLADGSIDVLATDHAPWTREQKLDPALSITNRRAGIANLQVMLPMYFSEGVVGGRISLERFVESTCTKPAEIFGLYPDKGVVQEGALADVVVWDPDHRATVRNESVLSRAGHTVYDGWEITGWPVVTVRRGEVVFENGTVTGRPGSGVVLPRTPWNG